MPMRLAPLFTRLALLSVVTLSLVVASATAATLPITTDLSLWLASDLGVTTSGSTVTGWADQSGNGHDGSYSSGAPQVGPLLNGLPTITFNGVGDYFALAGGQVLTSSNFTVFVVAIDTGGNNSDSREIYSNWDAGNSWSSVFIGTSTGVDATRTVRFTDGLSANDALATPASAFILTGAYQGGVNADLYLNGALVGSNAQNNLPADFDNPNGARDLSTPSFIGRQGSFEGESWQGQIAEVLVYNTLLSAEDQAAVNAYLTEKWFAVPEPGSLVLLCLGSFALLLARRRG